MTPEEWHKVKEVLETALDLDPQARADFLDSACRHGTSVRDEVESLLRSHDEHATFLEQFVAIITHDRRGGTAAESLIGKRLGSYQVLEQIGKGGMGEVFRACRADDQFQKQVAIKLLRAGEASPFVVSRFRNERQILASLDHPNIARLLDGGTTETGIPYLVMELVEGSPIDNYCDAHKLPTTQRLKIFLEICAAVQYAHQRLIVHRDLKPGNILVTQDGVPKLLDFGIAKILDKESEPGRLAPTITVFRALTPAYASPEQVKGEPITTASDVYSLGVVLYELLTGIHPYRKPIDTPEVISRAVCETEPDKPSNALRRSQQRALASRGFNAKLIDQLRGDLDNIVLLALRKEARQRYPSVEHFAEDILRYLQSLPVTASRGNWSYRARKFVKRHKPGVTAAAVVIAIALTAFLVILREVRIAREQRTRAEQRFNDVRKLANSLIFDIHDSIQDLPGSTPARKMLIERALTYLDSLAKESGVDSSLLRELAAGYDKVGDVQGTPFGSNLGDTKAAMESYEKALAIRERVAAANPRNLDDTLAVAQSQRRIAGMAAFRGSADGIEKLKQTLAVAERVLHARPQNPAAIAEVSIVHAMLAAIMDGAGDYEHSIHHARARLSILEQQLRTDPGNRSLRGSEAVTEGRICYELAIVGSREEAEPHCDRSLQIAEFLAADPMDVERKRIYALMLQWSAGDRLGWGDYRASFRSDKKAAKILEPLAAADPKNLELDYDLASDFAGEGTALSFLDEKKRGLALLKRASEMFESELARDPAYTEPRNGLGRARIVIGDILARSGDSTAALESYEKALPVWEKMAAETKSGRDRSGLATTRLRIAETLARIGRTEEASREFQQALQIAEPMMATTPIPDAKYVLAELYATLGAFCQQLAIDRHRPLPERAREWNNARTWYQRSMEMWRRIPNPSAVTPLGFAHRGPESVAVSLARCTAASSDGQSSR